MNAALQKVLIKDLNINQTNIMVVGIIIGKQKPKVIVGKNDQPRAVWNFTIRDSPAYYINVAYWGSVEQILQTNEKFKTGDVVEIFNPQIFLRKLDDRAEQFVPMVTSPYRLYLTDYGNIISHPDGKDYLGLLRYPTKPTAAFYPLQGIHNSGKELYAKGFYVDILVAVRGLGSIRTVTTKYNETLQVRDIEVFDHTSPSLKVTLWEPDLINRSNSWKPRFTILFMTDLQIAWSNFSNTFIGKVTNRSIVTEDPITKEATNLLSYAKNAPIETFDIVEQMATSFPSANSTEEVLNVRQLQSRLNECLENHKQHGNKSFAVVLYAFLTSFDLDGLSETLWIKCGQCAMNFRPSKFDPVCPNYPEPKQVDHEVSFDIKVSITDHTGTLNSCRMSGQAASSALNCSAAEFMTMSNDQKYALKWRYLLQRCKIRMGIFFAMSQNPVLLLLSIEQADPIEVASKLSV